jgi:ferredoxin--NADP+ reductase
LSLTPEELHRTDIADYAMKALNRSKIKEISILGRRGPLQAAFTTPEIKELGTLSDAEVLVLPEEGQLDPLSQADLETLRDRRTENKVRLLQEFTRVRPTGKSRTIKIRFLVSPVEVLADESGRAARLRLVVNELYRTDAGTLRPRSLNTFQEIPAGLVFHSVGYKGVALPGIPFDHHWGVIPNKMGRIIDPQRNTPLPGLFTAGWIKRGPSGVIGTNKPDASDTVEGMVADLERGIHLNPAHLDADSAAMMVRQRQPRAIIFKDWKHLDVIELNRGDQQNRPRVKFTQIDEMLSLVETTKAPGD